MDKKKKCSQIDENEAKTTHLRVENQFRFYLWRKSLTTDVGSVKVVCLFLMFFGKIPLFTFKITAQFCELMHWTSVAY